MSFSYFKDVLPSGLRVVTVETPHLHTAVVAAYVRTGSRHEQPTTNGVSHFLEHLFFRGSEAFPDTVKMNAAVEDVGGNLNGVTTRDHGYYYTPLHPDHLDVGIRILGDMLTRPLLREMEIERQIILEEMLDEVDEEGRDIDLENLAKRALFGEHPLALKIAGTPQSVRDLRLDQVRSHLSQHYVAQNLVFTAAGNVKREQVLAEVARSFAALPSGTLSHELPPPPPQTGPSFQFVEHPESQTAFRLSFVTVPEQHPDYAALLLLRRVLDDGLSSRLPFNVVEKRGLAYGIHAGIEAFDDVGIFEIEGASAPDKAGLVIEEVATTLIEIAEKGVTEDELVRAQRRHRMSLDFVQDSPNDLAGWFGGTEIFRPPESFADRIRVVDAQTVTSLRDIARRYLTRANLSTVAVGPKKSGPALEKVVRQIKLP